MINRLLSRLLTLLTVVFLACAAPNAANAQTAGGSDSDTGTGDSKSSKPAKARQRVTMKLPDEHRSKDKDKDGQIGMYEWSRNDYATFRKLDLNGDGFITPLEFSRAGKSKRSASAEVVSSGTGSARGTSTTATAASSTTSTTSTAETPAETPAEPAADAPVGNRSEAERQFDTVDKDKDGKISEAEFQKSFLTKSKFNKAGITLSFPVGRDEFLRVYPAAK